MGWMHVRRLSKAASPAELIVLLGDTGKLLALYALLLSAGLVLAEDY
jgi:1,4-dihydroxy-2-naphthoate polyprenyltransferase